MLEDYDWLGGCSLKLLDRVSLERVIEAYSQAYLHGQHGELPDEALLDVLRSKGKEWVLAQVPLHALNYQTEWESGPPRIARAQAYAQRKGAFPPGIATYSGRSHRRAFRKAYVLDGNHRTLAAQFRKDCTIRMYMPADDFFRLKTDAP